MPNAARLQQGLGLVEARGVTKGWPEHGDYSPGRVPRLRPLRQTWPAEH